MELTCINCPLGCTINILKEGDRILVEGNSCPRGEKYARDELLQPKRMLTSTIYVNNGERVSCKSKEAVDKDRIFEVMDAIKKARVNKPVHIGDILIKDIAGTDIVATKNVEEKKDLIEGLFYSAIPLFFNSSSIRRLSMRLTDSWFLAAQSAIVCLLPFLTLTVSCSTFSDSHFFFARFNASELAAISFLYL